MSSTPPIPPELNAGEQRPPAPAPPAPPASGYLTCDFCKCKLTRTGEVINVSEDARTYRDEKEKHGKKVVQLEEQIGDLTKKLQEKEQELAGLRASAGSQRPFL